MFTSRSTLRFLSLLTLVLAAALLATGCGGDDDGDTGSTASKDTTTAQGGGEASGALPSDVAERNGFYDAPPSKQLKDDVTYVVEVSTSEGDFEITLDQKAGPIAAANFAFLVEEGYYDGVVFHRIIKDFMVQSGDPTGTGTGGPGYSLKDDPVKGEYVRGTVAMANAGPDTGGSQFFIVHGTEVDQQLGKDYVIFGSVDEQGMKVVDKIASVEVEPGPTGEPSSPVRPVTIKRAVLVER